MNGTNTQEDGCHPASKTAALRPIVKPQGTEEPFGNAGLAAALKVLTKRKRNAWNHEQTDGFHPDPGGERPEAPMPCASVCAFTGGRGSSHFISRQSRAAPWAGAQLLAPFSEVRYKLICQNIPESSLY